MDDKDKTKEYWEEKQIKLRNGGPIDLNKGIAIHKEGDSDWEKFKDFQDKLEAKLWYPAKWNVEKVEEVMKQRGVSIIEDPRIVLLQKWHNKLMDIHQRIDVLLGDKKILILKSRRAGYRSQPSMKLIELHLELDEHLAKVYKIEKK